MKNMRTLAALAVGTVLIGTASCAVEDPADVEESIDTSYATAYPFGARVDHYPFGTVVNHISTAAMDATIAQHYDAWKAARIVDVPTVPGGKAVLFNDGQYITVSEGMGYGMLITVLMAGHDANAQAIFDGLLKTVRARPAYSIPASSGGPYLMDWRLTADGSSTDAAGGGWNALDADLDIAMALLMADRQWGSGGAWNYKAEAIRTINAMKAWNFHADGTPMSNQRTSRTSDYMIGHFRAFGAATGDAFWTTVIDRCFALIDRMQKVYSPNAGLMPDFIVGVDTAAPYPSPGGQIESATEGDYFANGQRNPWRWGTDYVFSGDARWKGVLTKMMNFFVADTGGTPGAPVSQWGAPGFFGNFPVGYHIDGSHLTGNWPAIGIAAGAMNGAQIDPTYQRFLNLSWDWLEAKWTTNYYDSELTLLSMVVASGNWWNPTPTSSSGGSTPPPPTPPSPTPTTGGARIQAEQGAIAGSGVGVHTDLAGYEGSGFVGSFTTNGDRLTVTTPSLAAGSYSVKIHYHAWGAQQNLVSINGGAATSQAFPGTGSAWGDKTLTGVALAAGTNTVTIAKEWGYMDVDWIEIVGAGSTPPPPPSTATPKTIHQQAEAGVTSGSGVGVHTDLSGYEGSGFVGSFTTNGDRLTVSFPNVVGATYTVRIRYHAWTDQQNDVAMNAGAFATQSFPQTGSGWAVKTIANVALPTGTSTVAIRKNWGYMDIDWIEVVPQ